MTHSVLFIGHEASRTGAPIVLLNLQRWLRQNESFSFRTVTERSGALSGDFSAIGNFDSIEPNGLIYRILRRLGLNGYWKSSHLRRIQNALEKVDFDVIYINSIASGKIIDIIPRKNSKIICHVHELSGLIRVLGVDNIRSLEVFRPKYIAISYAVKACLVDEFGIEDDRVEVVHGFIPQIREGILSSEQARQALARELNIPTGAKIVCGCGSIEANKGTDLFLEVARLTLARAGVADIHFVWVGGTPDRADRMRKQVRDEGLASHVHFVGHKANPLVYFAASDVFLLTSREEALGLVVLEAALNGVPTVCFSGSGGAPEFVGEDAGFCVPDFDVSTMSRRVLELVSSNSLRDRMGNAARRKVEAHHNLEQGASEIASHIREAIRGGGTAQAEPVPSRSEKTPEVARSEPFARSRNGATSAQ